MVSLDREATSLAFCQRCGQLTCRDCATTNLEMDMYLCGRCVNPSIDGDSLAIALDCLFQKRFGQGLAMSVTTARQAVLALFQNNNEGGRCQQIFQYWLRVFVCRGNRQMDADECVNDEPAYRVHKFLERVVIEVSTPGKLLGTKVTHSVAAAFGVSIGVGNLREGVVHWYGEGAYLGAIQYDGVHYWHDSVQDHLIQSSLSQLVVRRRSAASSRNLLAESHAVLLDVFAEQRGSPIALDRSHLRSCTPEIGSRARW